MRGLAFGVLTAIVVGVQGPLLSAQQQLDLDLAQEASGAQILQSIAPGTYVVRIHNTAPKNDYSISVVLKTIPIVGLASPGSLGTKKVENGTCKNLTDSADKLAQTTDEQEVPRDVARLRAILDTARGMVPGDPDLNCSDVSIATDLLSRTERTTAPATWVVRSGQSLDLIVTRNGKGDVLQRQWTKTFTTGSVGGWHYSYGYMFPIQGGLRGRTVSWAPHYFAQKSGTQYVIAHEPTRDRISYEPIAMVSFTKTQNENAECDRGWMAALGLDVANHPLAAFGYGWTYYQFLHLSLGAVVHREARLKDQYHVGDLVANSLSTDDLTQGGPKLRMFISLGVRFT